jgi:hypothetical protein
MDTSYLAWPTDRESYGRLTRFLSLGRMRAPKGECQLTRTELLDHAEGWVMAAIRPALPDAAFAARLKSDARDPLVSGKRSHPVANAQCQAALLSHKIHSRYVTAVLAIRSPGKGSSPFRKPTMRIRVLSRTPERVVVHASHFAHVPS